MLKVQSYVELAKKEGCTIYCGLEELHLPDKNKNVSIVIYSFSDLIVFFRVTSCVMRPIVITNVSDES